MDIIDNPIRKRCELILARGPVCEDAYITFTEQRRYVLCKAFQLMKRKEVKTFGEAIKKSWEDIHVACPWRT